MNQIFVNKIFGIDFGTTYTLVSWWDKQINFLPLNKFVSDTISPIFLPTEINGQKHLKRQLAEFLTSYNHIDNENILYKNIVQFFRQLNELIEENLGIEGVKQCVLTVPARFNDIARNAIKAAAIQGGFHIIKLLAEPVAAAIYTIREQNTISNQKEAVFEGYYLVYDLGGGTFDATLLKFSDNVFQILAIDGLANFGGIDIDNLIMQRLNLGQNQAIEYKHRGIFSAEIKEEIENLLKLTYEIIYKILKTNELDVSKINNLILAGGSSALPMIEFELSKNFNVINNINCLDNLNPDQIVCAGAAYYGAKMHDNSSEHILIDALPFNLGIETIGSKMEVIIPANTSIPVYKSQYFQPVGENGVLINILQSVNENIEDAVSLAKFQIDANIGINGPFEVVFMFDYDGILSIKIGQQIYTIANIAKNVQKNTSNVQVQELLARAQKYQTWPNLNKRQEEYIEYLKQAEKINLSQAAIDWLISEFEKLFIE